jgi:uncharacterized protein (TIGR00251 family)
MAQILHSPVLAAIEGGVRLRLRVQPGAKAERLDGVHDDALRLRLTAPPVDGAANTACLAFLAETLGVRRSQITLQSGRKSRHKVLRIQGVTLQQAAAVLGIFHSTA